MSASRILSVVVVLAVVVGVVLAIGAGSVASSADRSYDSIEMLRSQSHVAAAVRSYDAIEGLRSQRGLK